MSFGNTIKSGYLGALSSKGRMGRKAYWQFFPIALVMSVLFASQLNWLEIQPWRGIATLVGLFILALPLLTATARRLNDADLENTQAFYPFAPFVILWIGCQRVFLGIYLSALIGGIWGIVLLIAAALLLVPLHIIGFFATIVITANGIGQTLVASLHDQRDHGPNPHEVLS